MAVAIIRQQIRMTHPPIAQRKDRSHGPAKSASCSFYFCGSYRPLLNRLYDGRPDLMCAVGSQKELTRSLKPSLQGQQ